MRIWSTDRTGRCSLDRPDLFAPGQPSAELFRPEPGTPEHDDAHQSAHVAAWRTQDPGERRDALSRVYDTYGHLGHSRTLRASST